MSEGPRYATLGDYLRVIRRHRLLILVITVAFGASANALSKSQEPVYIASTSISFKDVSQDAAVLGVNILPQQAGAERAAVNAELVTRPEITQPVSKRLKRQLSPDELADAVEAGVDIRTNLVTLEAESSDPELAARIANAFGAELERQGVDDLDRRLNQAEESLENQIKTTKKAPDTGPKAIEISVLQQQLSRLQTLRAVAEPVVVNRRASVPSSPDSPQPARNTVIGVIIGFIIGLLAAFVRSSLDRRLYTPHDIHEELGLPVLGRVPDSALGLAGLAPDGKAQMGEADFEAFRMLRTNLGYFNQDGGVLPRSLLVTSALPEEGKSSVSMALASAAALAGQRVLLVECDLRRPSFAHRLPVNAEPGLTDYLQGTAGPRDILQTVELAPPSIGNGATAIPGTGATLVCIAAGTQVATPAELLVSERFSAFLEKVSHAYDLVVIDSSPLLSVVDPLEIAPLVDAVLVCVRVQQTTRDQVRSLRAALGTLPERPMAAVVTGIKRGDRDSGDYYYGY